MAIRAKVNLKNYRDEIKTFDIALSSRSDSDLTIIYTKQSGDEVVYIFEFGNKTYELDAGDEDGRTFDLLDDLRPISLDELLALNKEESDE